MTNMEPNKGEIVMYQPDETIRLEVSHWDRFCLNLQIKEKKNRTY